jgi:hypothetical protein
MVKTLKSRHEEVLRALAKASEADPKAWIKPSQVGGTSGSRHSLTLKQLWEHELVARDGNAGQVRTTYRYRLLASGRRYLAKLQAPKKAKR